MQLYQINSEGLSHDKQTRGNYLKLFGILRANDTI